MKRLVDSLKKLEGKSIILMHSAADIDSFSSAAMLWLALNKKPLLACPDKLNKESQKLASRLKISYQINPSLKGIDSLILVDFNSLKLLNGMQESLQGFKGKIILIDHHSKSEDKIKAGIEFIDEASISTSMIVFGLLKAMKIPLTRNLAILLASGIIADSAGFLTADKKSFALMAEALQASKMDYLGLINLFKTEPDASEKIASLKALRRAKIYRLNGFIFCTSKVSCFESTAAENFVRVGCDAAFVVSEEKKETRLSARASNSFIKLTGFDLTKILHAVDLEEKRFPGSAGGHPAAAGFTAAGKVDADALLARCIQLSVNFMQKKFPGIQPKEY